MKQQAITSSTPRFLGFLILCYVVIFLLANWFDPRLVKVFGLTTDAGTLIFPLTFLLSGLMTEVYGYKQARRAIWAGLFFNFCFLAYGQLISHLPNPDFPTQNAAFDALLAMNGRIIVASTISYLCAEPLNVLILAKLKIKMKGKYMGLRFLSSTIFAAAVDSTIFSAIAFYGYMSNENLVKFIATMWLIKVVIELLGLPLSLKLTRKLKKVEGLDIYDTETKFSLFSLNSKYQQSDNKFKDR